MFSLLFVCLSLCQQNYSKCCGPIFMKLGGWRSGPGSVFNTTPKGARSGVSIFPVCLKSRFLIFGLRLRYTL